MNEDFKTPPHSIEAEQSVLGGLMLDSQAWDKVSDVIVEGDFYRHDHQLIFAAIRALCNGGQPCDVIVLSEWLEQRNQLAEAGGLAYLGTIANNTPSAANIAAYANIVRERSIKRQLIQVGGDISASGFSPEGKSIIELLDNAETKVFEIAEQGMKGAQAFQAIQSLLSGAVEKLEERFSNPNGILGLATGFTDFDRMTSGLQNSDLVIVAGRPSMGKTAFSMNLAENVAIQEKKGVAIFSLEMPADQLTTRMLASLGRIDSQKMRTGNLSDEDWHRVTSAITLLNDAPIYIDDTPALTPTDVRARARRLKREEPNLGLIVIDYLQLMQTAGKSENRVNEISEISRSLKALAKELNIPVIALSQLNRSLESRTDKRPVMSDLRESGAIEQDADVIIFIYRDEVYHEDSTAKGTAEIIIGKQRNGPIGKTRLAFLGECTRFEDLAPGSYNDESLH